MDRPETVLVLVRKGQNIFGEAFEVSPGNYLAEGSEVVAYVRRGDAAHVLNLFCQTKEVLAGIPCQADEDAWHALERARLYAGLGEDDENLVVLGPRAFLFHSRYGGWDWREGTQALPGGSTLFAVLYREGGNLSEDWLSPEGLEGEPPPDYVAAYEAAKGWVSSN